MTITIERYKELMDDYCGICLNCGAEREMTEPDAENYPCDECGERAVFGADNLLLMGVVV